MNDLLYWLSQIKHSNRFLVGEKAFALSQLQQQGYPILPGFVISGGLLRQFLEKIVDCDSILADFPASSLYVNVDNPHALRLAAQQSRQSILAQSLPAQWLLPIVEACGLLESPSLIFRASLAVAPAREKEESPLAPIPPAPIPPAPLKGGLGGDKGGRFADFSGLFSSQVCGNNSPEIELALKTIWAQLFSAKTLFYSQRIGIRLEEINLAVLVQPITAVRASGIAHVKPNLFQIQGTWGLGYSLLYGQVLGDVYQVDALTGKVQNQQLGNKILAYRLSDTKSSLETYLLSEEEQNNFCLDEILLGKLTQILRDMSLQNSKDILIEWILLDRDSTQFYLTHITTNLPENSPDLMENFQPMMVENQPILKGLSASPGIAIAPTYIVTDCSAPLEKIDSRIIVTREIDLDWILYLKNAGGIIAEKGDMTSHGAIIARELGIPAIVGVTGATQILQHGELIKLDGNKGEIFSSFKGGNDRQLKSQTARKINRYDLGASSPIGTQLMVNISQINSLERDELIGVDGVGLLRSDLMLIELLSKYFPQQDIGLQTLQDSLLLDDWRDLIITFAKYFAPRPVFYRSCDWMLNYFGKSKQKGKNNYYLNRGTYSYYLNPNYFDLELNLLAQVYGAGYRNVNLILPFVRSVEEFRFCRSRVEQVGLTKYPSFKLWIMAEVPSVIFQFTEYIEAGIQGVAIGTNDLGKLLLGFEGENTVIPPEVSAIHPAMLIAIETLITQSKKAGIPCSICGQAPVQYPSLIEHLIRWGITTISVELDALETTYREIARAEQRLLLEKARN